MTSFMKNFCLLMKCEGVDSWEWERRNRSQCPLQSVRSPPFASRRFPVGTTTPLHSLVPNLYEFCQSSNIIAFLECTTAHVITFITLLHFISCTAHQYIHSNYIIAFIIFTSLQFIHCTLLQIYILTHCISYTCISCLCPTLTRHSD
jgi:hypothetical protein